MANQTSLLLHRRRQLWTLQSQNGSESLENRYGPIRLSPDGNQLALVLKNSLHILNMSHFPAISDSSASLSPNEVVPLSMAWCPGGTTIGIAFSDGKLHLFTAFGIEMQVLDFPSVIENMCDFDFFTGTLTLASTAEGKLFAWNISSDDVRFVTSVNNYHRWPQFRIDREQRFCVMGGALTPEAVNVTVWSFEDDLLSWKLLFALRPPISGWRSWMRGSFKDITRWSFYASVDGKRWTISFGSLPLILDVHEDSFKEIVLDASLKDVMSTATAAVPWGDAVLVLTTQIEKMVFLEANAHQGKVLGYEPQAMCTRPVGSSEKTAFFISLDTTGDGNLEWQLFSLERQTPSEHLYMLIEESKYEAAIDIAERAGLSKEPIYKEIWRSREDAPIRLSEFEDFMQRIQDPDWILQVCCSVTAMTPNDQRRILEYGRSICKTRFKEDRGSFQIYLNLLKSVEALNTFEALHPGCFSAEAFQEYRSEETKQIASSFAKSGNLNAIQVLFKFHAHSLFDDVLEILQQLSCIYDRRGFSKIAPKPEMTPEDFGYHPTFDNSWMEPLRDLEAFSIDAPSLNAFPDVLLHTLRSNGKLNTPKLSGEAVSAFYVMFAARIEQETGNLASAKNVLEFGKRHNVEGLQQAIHNLEAFENWLSIGHVFWNWNSEAFAKLNTRQRIEHFFQSTSEDDIVPNVENVLVPMALKMHSEDKTAFAHCLFEYALCRKTTLFKDIVGLESIQDIFIENSTTGFQEFVKITVGAIETVDKISDWTIIYDALDDLNKRYAQENTRMEKLQSMESILDNSSLGATLEKYGIHVTHLQMKTLTVEEGRRLLKSVLGNAVRSGTRWSDERWEVLLSDLTHLHLKICHRSNQEPNVEDVKLDYFQALLRASKFTLAEEFIATQEDLRKTEACAWETGREILCSITDLDSLDAIDHAKMCFALFPDSKRARDEVTKLKVLTFIRFQFGVVLLPLEFEQLQKRPDVVERILSKSEKMYKKRPAFLTVCEDLRFTDEEILESWKMLSAAALKYNDLRIAMELFSDLRKRDISQSWSLALDILTTDQKIEYLNTEDKTNLWRFVICHCDRQLQESIEQMKPAFVLEPFRLDQTTVSKDGFPSCKDALWYISDEIYRRSYKTANGSFVERKCKVYDFVREALLSVNNTSSEATAFVRLILELSPYEIREILKQHNQNITQLDALEIETFDQLLNSLEEQNRLQNHCQHIQMLLPGLDAKKFCDHANLEYRKQIILELSAYAGELLCLQSKGRSIHDSKSNWRDALRIAIEEGEEFEVNDGMLYLRFVCSVCSVIDQPFEVIEAAVVEVESMLQNKTEYLQQLIQTTWQALDNPYGLAMVLRIVKRCLEDHPCVPLLDDFTDKILSRIKEFEDFDFRDIAFPVLSKIGNVLFKLRFEWNSDIPELQKVYQVLKDSNCDLLGDLYAIRYQIEAILMGTQSSEEEISASLVHLCFIVKQWIQEGKNLPLANAFWTQHVPYLSTEHLIGLIQFAILGQSSSLESCVKMLDNNILEHLRSWNNELDDKSSRIEDLICLLEIAIDHPNAPTTLRDSWVRELKKLRQLKASQGFSNLGVVSGDNFVENAERVIKRMILDLEPYQLVHQSITDFAQKSDETSQSDAIHTYIRTTIMKLLKEFVHGNWDELSRIVAFLDSDLSGVQRLQEEVWDFCMENLRESCFSNAAAISSVSAIIETRIWKNREWNIPSEHRWMVFSTKIALQCTQLQNVTLQTFHSFEVASAELEKLVQKFPPSTLCTILEKMSSAATLLGNEVNFEWLCPYYFATFRKALEAKNPELVLRCLCHHYTKTKVDSSAFPILTESQAQDLISEFKSLSTNLATCFGLLLQFESIQKKVVDQIWSMDGDGNTLAIVLNSNIKVDIDEGLNKGSWLMKVLRNSAPHPSLFPHWSKKTSDSEIHVNENEIDEKANFDPGSMDGWDIDDDLNFEAQPSTAIPAPASEGWSDIEELEVTLQATNPDSVADEENVQDMHFTATGRPLWKQSMKEEDNLWIVSCCFGTVLAKLVYQGRMDLACSFLLEKMNIHPSVDVLAIGPHVLSKFFKKWIEPSTLSLSGRDERFETLWSGSAVLDVIRDEPSAFEQALQKLSS